MGVIHDRWAAYKSSTSGGGGLTAPSTGTVDVSATTEFAVSVAQIVGQPTAQTFTPDVDGIMTATLAATASGTGGQGAYCWPALVVAASDEVGDPVLVLSSTSQQVVQNPLADTPIEGEAVLFLLGGITYAWVARGKCGTGANSIFVQPVSIDYSFQPL